MERKLKKLFDYQRFAKDKGLDLLIGQTVDKYENEDAFEMADSSLLLVAGGKKEVDQDKDELLSSNKDLGL